MLNSVLQSIPIQWTKLSARHIEAIHAMPWTEIYWDWLAHIPKQAACHFSSAVSTVCLHNSSSIGIFKSHLKMHLFRPDFFAALLEILFRAFDSIFKMFIYWKQWVISYINNNNNNMNNNYNNNNTYLTLLGAPILEDRAVDNTFKDSI